MSTGNVLEAFGNPASTDLTTQIGQFATRLEDIASEMGKAKDEDTARYQTLKEEQRDIAAKLTELHDAKAKADRDVEVQSAIEVAREWKARLLSERSPSKAQLIGSGNASYGGTYEKGAFVSAVAGMKGNPDEYASAKATLDTLGVRHEEAWGKATLGTSDATGGWLIPNAIVDEFIRPPSAENIYRALCTVVTGVTAATVDIPFRAAAPNRAIVAAWGTLKENVDLAYNGYTATMYTLARIYDVSNQFLRHSRGAAEQDVFQTLGEAFALGESYYIREGSGSSEPFGYTSALTNGPAAFRTTFSPSATTLAGSIAKAIATAAGDLAGRSGRPTAAVLTAAAYWNMISQGTDTAGFFFNPANGPTAIPAPPGTLVSPFGIPVYPDPGADQIATAAVIDNLVVGNWKKFKIYFGDSYRVDTSTEAGTRWDYNLTGFRGEEEMGFDARPAVYAGHFQMITDIIP